MAIALAGGFTPGTAGPARFAGLVLGAQGYVLGAHRLGTAVLALSATKILVALASR